MSTGRLDGKIAIVTGGASGIGAAIAAAYAREGAKVTIADINEENAKKTVDAIVAAGNTAEFIKTEMTDREQVKAMAQAVKDKYGRVDILANSCGFFFAKPFLECTEEDWWKVMDNNLLSYCYAMWEVLPFMEEQNRGAVVNISAKIGGCPTLALENFTFYAFANAGITMLTKCVQLDYTKEGIRINAIAPGIIKTEQTENNEYAKKLVDCVPMGRFGEPEEVANVAVFLASDEASFLSGSCIEMDGGHVTN